MTEHVPFHYHLTISTLGCTGYDQVFEEQYPDIDAARDALQRRIGLSLMRHPDQAWAPAGPDRAVVGWMTLEITPCTNCAALLARDVYRNPPTDDA